MIVKKFHAWRNARGSGGTTLDSSCSQEHPDLKKKLYIIIKFFLFVYPFKKNYEHPQIKKNKKIICSTFKQKKKKKKKAQKIFWIEI